MRVDANVSVRPVGHRRARHALRDQERQLAALARPGHRVRGAPPGRPDRGGRAGPPGDPPLGRGGRAHPRRCAPRRRPTTTATSPSPTWCVLDPSAEWIESSPCRAAAAAGRAPRAPGRGGRGRAGLRWPSTSSGASTTWPSGAIEAGGDPARVLTHVEHNLAVDGAADLDPARLAGLVAPRAGRPADRHPGQGGAGRDGGHRRRARGHRRRPRLRGHGRRRSRPPWSTGSSPPTPTTGTSYVGGDDKRRKKVTGAFIGKVMKATQGQADGRAATALLEAAPRPELTRGQVFPTRSASGPDRCGRRRRTMPVGGLRPPREGRVDLLTTGGRG